MNAVGGSLDQLAGRLADKFKNATFKSVHRIYPNFDNSWLALQQNIAGSISGIPLRARLIAKKDGLRFVEYGIGSGDALIQAVRDLEASGLRNIHAYGIGADISMAISLLMKAHYEHKLDRHHCTFTTPAGNSLTLIEGNAHFASTLVPEKVDAIYSQFTFRHLTLPWFTLGESLSLLRTGGLFAVDYMEPLCDAKGRYFSREKYQAVFSSIKGVVVNTFGEPLYDGYDSPFRLSVTRTGSFEGIPKLQAGMKGEEYVEVFDNPAPHLFALDKPGELHATYVNQLPALQKPLKLASA